MTRNKTAHVSMTRLLLFLFLFVWVLGRVDDRIELKTRCYTARRKGSCFDTLEATVPVAENDLLTDHMTQDHRAKPPQLATAMP